MSMKSTQVLRREKNLPAAGVSPAVVGWAGEEEEIPVVCRRRRRRRGRYREYYR